MTYEQAQKFISYTNSLGSRLGLTSIKELLHRLQEPQEKCPVVHIAGTNGKGSIFAFLESVLISGGYRVGRYISPTVFTYLERYQINGEYMSKGDFCSYAKQVKEACDSMVLDGFEHPTSFEVETAIGFLYFQKEKVDLLLLETGMGGREDATNVVSKPLATVFASISMDHMGFLGDTLEKIATEKAGIMRENVPCVIAPMAKTAKDTLISCGQKLHCPIQYVDPKEIHVECMDLDGSKFRYKDKSYFITQLGTYQVDNGATAIAAYKLIEHRYPMTEEAFAKGLKNCIWKGRFEVLKKNPLIIRDGAHNVDAVKQLKNTLLCYFKGRNIRFIMGILKDKEHGNMVREIAPIAKCIYTITPPIAERALEAKELAEELKETLKGEEIFVQPCDSVDEALANAISRSSEEDVIVVFGSLSFLGQIHV